MDYLLPDDGTMELMRAEFEKLKCNKTVRPLSLTADDSCAAPSIAYITGALLFLYFVKLLSYNACYGTQIYDPHRSVGRVRSRESAFGELNNLL